MKQRKQRSKKLGQKFESKVQKTINSGQLWFDKGDLKTEDYLVECKFTEKKGFRISTKLLEKIWEEALTRAKLPILVIGLKDKDIDWTLNVHIERKVH